MVVRLSSISTDESNQSSSFFIQYARIILPHVGLILLSLGYILGGSAIFYHLERPHELAVRNANLKKIDTRRRQFLDLMWTNMDKLGIDEWHRSTLAEVDNMTKLLLDAFDTRYIVAAQFRPNWTISSVDETWTMITSIFFTTTLLTTIGYGNLVPKTFQGRMFCIGYGLFGVPLILITIADIGKFLSENIVWTYCHYVKLKFWLKRKLLKRGSKVQVSSMANNGDEQAKLEEQLVKFGLEDFISIPVLLILAILIGYIAIGAVLLGSWEEWDFFRGFYFAFITITTVGFGDIVPEKKKYFLLDLLYIIIGLSITTMCIDLVGLQYIRKIHYFGRAIKDARHALVNVGGRMVNVGEFLRYASVLQQKYGMNKEVVHVKSAFTPEEIRTIRYIDYEATDSYDSLRSLPLQDHNANTSV